MPHRVEAPGEAVAEVAMKIREESMKIEDFDGFWCRHDVEVKDKSNMGKMVPYVTSVNLLQWALSELEMPKGLVCRAIAYSGHLDVMQWARAQDPPCAWDEDVCKYAAKGGHWDGGLCEYATLNGHVDVIDWLRTQNLPDSWLDHFPESVPDH